MNAKITQGKRQLWQWDTGVQLMLFDIGTANEVHFATPDGVIRRDIVNNMCNIPDVVLQRAGTMVCYVFNREPYEGDTRHEFHFDVLPRPKPADYIDPPGEADYLDQLYDRLKDEIVGPPGPQGERGEPGPAGPAGLPGTSVSITSISQSTEDDGYSVVTFSDGKQLRVKNGSKGSAGEGGAGGGVVTVYCQPSDDMQSFTASMTVEEIRTAFEEHKAVQAIVLGMGIVAHAFMVTEDMVAFSGVATVIGESMALMLSMMADGTNIMTISALGGMVVANITTEDGVTYTTDKTAEELYAAVTMGTPVYASFMGAYVPAQYIGEESSVFRVAVPGGTVTAIIDGSGVTVDVAPEGGGVTIVHVTEVMNGAYETDMMAEDIYARYSAGERVVCHLVPNAGIKMFLSPIVVTDTVTIFSGIFDAQGQYTMSVSVTVTNDTKAIIAKTPLDKLPNPQPLTINGTSYDGSEAVNIDIAAGGGGGGDEGVYELIETYTTTESVAFERTQEPDGIKYKFKALLVKFDIASGTSGYFRLNANYGNTSLGGCIITPISNSRCYAMFETTQEKGFWRDMSCDAITVQDRFTTPIFHGWGDLTSKGVQRFPYISKLISSGPIPAGVKMEIWGVRV